MPLIGQYSLLRRQDHRLVLARPIVRIPYHRARDRGEKLPRAFFGRGTLAVARELIGMHLVTTMGSRARRRIARPSVSRTSRSRGDSAAAAPPA